MTSDMHECELHLAQIFGELWDQAYENCADQDYGELGEDFFNRLYIDINRQCSTLDNLDVQFDTVETRLQYMPPNTPIAGIAYALSVAYQIEAEPFGFTVYFGHARTGGDTIHHARTCDVTCLMSASEDQKEDQMLEHFCQFRIVGEA